MIKKELLDKATKTETRDITGHMKRFALNDQYKHLYDKVVPPLAIM